MKNPADLRTAEIKYNFISSFQYNNYFESFLNQIRKMAKQKNRAQMCRVSPNLTAQHSLQPFLVEKQVNNQPNFSLYLSEKSQKQSNQNALNSQSTGGKRRGRLQEKKWSTSETTLLYELHDQLGNQWKEIAKFFPDRSDNNVKNHFFSKLRLSLRQLNKVISKLLGPKKQIKNHSIYKITSVCQLKFKGDLNENDDLIQEACNLKKIILEYSQISPSEKYSLSIWQNINTFSNKIGTQKTRAYNEDSQSSQEINIDQIIEQKFQIEKTEVTQVYDFQAKDKNLLRAINQDDFVLTRNLTPNEKLLLSIPPDLQLMKAEEMVEKPAINIPENLFLSTLHSVDDSVFNLNLSDQSYFSQNQNISFYTDFLNQYPQKTTL